MGGGISVSSLPEKVDADTCKSALGELFNQDVFDREKDADGFVLRSHLKKLLNQTDIFLSHDWGHDLGQDNHQRVSAINHALKQKGLITWFDEEKMKGNIKEQMTKGIDNSQCIVVFITQRYVEKVASDNAEDNCKLEFNYSCLRKTANKMVAVVMEERMRNTSEWDGPCGMVLGASLYVDASGDLSDEAYLADRANAIYDAIINVIEKPIREKVPNIHIPNEKKALSSGNLALKKKTKEVPSDLESQPKLMEMKKWMEDKLDISSDMAKKYAILLWENGVASIKRAVRKEVTKEGYLVSLGIDEMDAKDILETFNKGQDPSKEITRPSPPPEIPVASNLNGDSSGVANEQLAQIEKISGAYLNFMETPNKDNFRKLKELSAHPITGLFLADIYFNGYFTIEKDEDRAEEYVEDAMDYLKGLDESDNHALHKYSDYLIALLLINGIYFDANVEEAFDYFKKSADQEYPPSLESLGECYLRGYGVKQSHENAFKYFKAAADLGYCLGQLKLGLCYLRGQGVEKNPLEGIKLLQQAATKDHPVTQYELSRCYQKGLGVAKDKKEAKKLYQKALKNGFNLEEYEEANEEEEEDNDEEAGDEEAEEEEEDEDQGLPEDEDDNEEGGLFDD